MASAAGTLDYWRKFFRSTNSDIIEVIECAILVATSDCPKELRSRRDQITEKLYTCQVPRCFDCDRAEQMQGSGGEEEDGGSSKREGEKESKASSSSSDGAEELNQMVSNYSYNEAEALTEEIEEESQTVGEVLRIKELLAHHQDESDNVLFESLRRLQLMDLSVETLKATNIGKAVNGLRKHSSKQIRQLVRTLIEDWKVLVDQWVSATEAIANNSPDSASPVDVEEEEGLPSPPLDEGALFVTHTTSIQLSEFFDGMDDDGNFRINDEFDGNREHGNMALKKFEPERKQRSPEVKGQVRRHEPVIKPTNVLEAPIGHAKHQDIDKEEILRQEHVVKQTKEEVWRQEQVTRQRKPFDAPNGQSMPQAINDKQSKHNTDLGPGRPAKLSTEKKVNGEMNAEKQSKQATTGSGPGRPQKLPSEKKASGEMNAVLQKKPPTALQDKLKISEETSLRAKLEAAKRKLHENYQQAENGLFSFLKFHVLMPKPVSQRMESELMVALFSLDSAKKQRTIQVMELHDIPKKAHVNRQPIPKHKSNIRNLINSRR